MACVGVRSGRTWGEKAKALRRKATLEGGWHFCCAAVVGSFLNGLGKTKLPHVRRLVTAF